VHESFLRYRRFRYLKIGLVVLGVSAVAYWVSDPPGARRGSTSFGYTLGAVSAALIGWLTWFGARKRSYFSVEADLRAWLSAHVYLGALLLLLVPLHAAFHFGPNVHTLAYVLMAAVIVSGFFGVVVYATVPRLMTENRPGQKLAALIEEIGAVDAECKQLAVTLPTPVAQAVARSVDETRIGGGLVRQLSGRDRRCPTTAALAFVQQAAGRITDSDAESRRVLQRLLERLAIKQKLLDRVRRDVRLKALLDVWLVVHVPLALATVAAVLVHVFVVFYYP
jgi:hypothetical protein